MVSNSGAARAAAQGAAEAVAKQLRQQAARAGCDSRPLQGVLPLLFSLGPAKAQRVSVLGLFLPKGKGRAAEMGGQDCG